MTKPDPEGGVRSALGRLPILAVAGFSLPDQSSHFFNELLGYKTAAEALGWTARLFVPRTADPRLAAQLSANTVLAPRPFLPGFDTGEFTRCFDAFSDATESMAGLWASLEADNLTSGDAMLFPEDHPVLICAAGRWLSGRPPGRRPAIFFRFVGNPINSATGQPTPHTLFYRLASTDLGTRAGNERVLFLVNNAIMARTVTRVCSRRVFLAPMPKFMPDWPQLASPEQSTIYIHLNERSGRLLVELSAVIRRVLASDPSVRFLVKFTLSCVPRAAKLDPDIAWAVEVLPAEQEPAAYLANFSRCTLVLLAYEPRAYTAITSGVFSEAAGFGKPVVAPAGTTMALDIANGHGAGALYETATPESVAAALIEALRSAARLGATARELVEHARNENTCLRFLERMIALARNDADTAPRYRVGDPIDFSNYFDSRCFMRGGWGETEEWGVWTIGPEAELQFWLEEEAMGQPLRLGVMTRPFLTSEHSRNRVGVSVDGEEVTEWLFDLNDPYGNDVRRCEAVFAPRRGAEGQPMKIRFSVETPMSPLALSLSADARPLGIGISEVSLSAAAAK